ncbi:M14 family zinc carboxypeptidase [Deinococcus sonorensis]|uniref:M14 family zinc carboxypeptidase n=2 Tax=Deinococcus sonorensis TaxID=309891 RepID=A0AAU7UFM1_9DEIO
MTHDPERHALRLDSTRPGPARHVWQAQFPWEGTRLLETFQTLRAMPGPLRVQAWVSESPDLRGLLSGSLQAQLRDRGQPGTVRVRSAYKPGYFWLSEEVRPLWRRLQADRLSVQYPLASPEQPSRFLQELYPLAALLEQEGVTADFQPGDAASRYTAALFRAGQEVWRGECFVPLHNRPSPDGRRLPSPTGWLRVMAAGELVYDRPLPTDGELCWDWYCEVVMPELLVLADRRPGLPVFRNLSATLHVSEPDLPLEVLDERVSMTEALSEELYFGTLDALKRHRGVAHQDRSLQPGRIVPVVCSAPGQDSRVQVVLDPWEEGTGPDEEAAGRRAWGRDQGSAPAGQPDRPWSPEALWAQARAEAGRLDLEWRVLGHSVNGRPVPGVLRPGSAGGVLVTGGQHANETTGPVAALRFISALAATQRPFAVLPLLNPDGAALHRALIQLNPEHMHHAARYTSLGDDLESRQRLAEPRFETRALVQAAQASGARLQLNLHGYPAHEWTRPYSGYAPYGFESWALPVGFLTIVWYWPGLEQEARDLAGTIARRLGQEPDVVAHAQRACRASAAHVSPPHYQLIGGLPFILMERPGMLCPLQVITEAPDETIYGQHFAMFVRAHLAVCEAAVQHLG